MSSDSESEGKSDRCKTPEFKKIKRGESLKKAKHRVQKYRREWENSEEFKGWLTADNGKLFIIN